MKYLFSITFSLFTFNHFSQNWRDTLDFARKAYKTKEYTKAIQLYKKAQKIAPNGIDLSNELAQTLYKAKSFSDAEKIYSKPIRARYDKIKSAQKYHNIGNSRMMQRNYKGAIEAYKQSLRNNPFDNETRYNLSEAIRKLKKQDNKNNQQKSPPKSQFQPKYKARNKSNQNSTMKNHSQNQKMVDRILDNLTKKESETKHKIGSNNKAEKGQTTSGKDW